MYRILPRAKDRNIDIGDFLVYGILFLAHQNSGASFPCIPSLIVGNHSSLPITSPISKVRKSSLTRTQKTTNFAYKDHSFFFFHMIIHLHFHNN